MLFIAASINTFRSIGACYCKHHIYRHATENRLSYGGNLTVVLPESSFPLLRGKSNKLINIIYQSTKHLLYLFIQFIHTTFVLINLTFPLPDWTKPFPLLFYSTGNA